MHTHIIALYTKQNVSVFSVSILQVLGIDQVIAAFVLYSGTFQCFLWYIRKYAYIYNRVI